MECLIGIEYAMEDNGLTSGSGTRCGRGLDVRCRGSFGCQDRKPNRIAILIPNAQNVVRTALIGHGFHKTPQPVAIKPFLKAITRASLSLPAKWRGS
jgi:hypothetical protein